jgi:ABC-type multidrug transport system ATPase subunit
VLNQSVRNTEKRNDLDKADQLADRIAVIDHGKVIAERSSRALGCRLSRRGGRDRKGAVVAHRGRRRHAAQALRQTSRTEM